MTSYISNSAIRSWIAACCIALLVILVAGDAAKCQTDTQGLSAIVIPSTDYAISDRWYRSLGETAPQLRTSKEVNRDQLFCVYLFVVRYNVDSTSTADVSFDFRITDESGGEVYGYENLVALDMPISNPKNVMMSKTTPVITLEPKHDFGEYSIEIEVRDNVSGLTTKASAVLSLIPYESADTPDGLSSGDWLANYYHDHEPQALVNACVWFMSSDFYENASPSGYGFFTAAFEQNPQLVPLLIETLADQKKNIRSRISKVLGTLDMNDPQLHQMGSIVRLRDELTEYENLGLLGQGEPISSPNQLDYLWGRFFATGSYEPIRRIVSAFELEPYLQYLDTSLSESWPHEPTQEDRLKGAICRVAAWSLRSNAEQHPLVSDYLKYMLAAEDLSAPERRQLTQVIED